MKTGATAATRKLPKPRRQRDWQRIFIFACFFNVVFHVFPVFFANFPFCLFSYFPSSCFSLFFLCFSYSHFFMCFKRTQAGHVRDTIGATQQEQQQDTESEHPPSHPRTHVTNETGTNTDHDFLVENNILPTSNKCLAGILHHADTRCSNPTPRRDVGPEQNTIQHTSSASP